MFLWYLLFFVMVDTNSLKLSRAQLKFISQLQERFAINKFIVISTHTEDSLFNGMYITKHLSQYNIQTAFMSSDQFNASMYRHRRIPTLKPKQLVLLDNVESDLLIIFNNRNEFYHSRLMWMIFDADESYFQNIYIPYNCEFLNVKTVNETDYELIEIYNVKHYDAEVYEVQLGTWNNDTGFELSQLDFYARRFDMNGTEMGIQAYFKESDCKHRWLHPILCKYVEIWTEFSRVMNFRTTYASWKQFRDLYRNGSKFDMEGKFGLFVFHSLVSSQHMVAPIWKTPAFLHIAYDKSYEQGYSSPYIQPFSTEFWMAIGFWIVFSGLVTTFIHYLAHKLNILPQFIFIDSLFLSYESFTNLCGSKIPDLISSRIVLIITRLGPWFVIPLYSAAILSFLTVKVFISPFTDLKGLIKDGSFKIGYENKTFLSLIFNNTNDEISKIALEKFVVPLKEMPRNSSVGIERMCKSKKFSFLMFNNDIFRLERKCKILQIPTPVVVAWDGFMLRTNSPYKNIFNRLVKTLFSAGILGRMGKIAYGKKPPEEKDNDPDPVELMNVLPLYDVVLSVYCCVLLIFALECFYVRFKK